MAALRHILPCRLKITGVPWAGRFLRLAAMHRQQ